MLAQTNSEDVDTSGVGGTNLRLRIGEREVFPVGDGVTGFINLSQAEGVVLSRVSLRDQGGMPVIQGTILVKGETIGVLSSGDEVQLLRQYTDPNFANWRNQIHYINWEFMNPGEAAVETLLQMLVDAGWPNYAPGPRAQRLPDDQRTSTTVFDRQAPGSNVVSRFASGMRLNGLVLIPDPRTGVLTTSYTNNEGQEVTRPGFTNFVDAQASAMVHLLQVTATGDQAKIREASQNLNLLTGRNADTQYPLRPTLGYFTPTVSEGSDPIEMDLFPVRSTEAVESTPAQESTPSPDGDEDDGDALFGAS